jgi:hypothetical protein
VRDRGPGWLRARYTRETRIRESGSSQMRV